MAINIPIISSLDAKGFDKAQKEFASLDGASAKTAFALKKAMLPAVAIIGGLGAAAVPAVKAASDLNETISKTSQIFGDADESVFKFAGTAAKQLGQTKTQALEAASTFAQFGKAAGLTGKDLGKFSTEFVTLASDLASFNNTPVDQAIMALGGALRGEAEPMRKFGVLLSQSAIEAKALSMGLITTTVDQDKLNIALMKADLAFKKQSEAITKYGEDSNEAMSATIAYESAQIALDKAVGGSADALTAQQKTLATQALIMSSTSDAQGDFIKTSDGLANSQKILSAEFGNMQAQMGQVLLPAVTALTKALTVLTGSMGDNQTAALIVIGTIAALAVGVIAANVAMKVYQATLVLTKIATVALNAVTSANPYVLVAAAVIALTAAMVYLEIKFQAMSKAFDMFGNAIIVVTGPLGVLIGMLRKLDSLRESIGGFNFGGISIPGFADGGIVTRPTLAMVGEKGPEAIIPMSQMGNMGGGGVTVNVTGGLATSAEIGQAVVNAIRAYNRSAGPAQIQVA
jgi:hypothetical protein